eukprot:2266621-Rhodomonas_salina.1
MLNLSIATLLIRLHTKCIPPSFRTAIPDSGGASIQRDGDDDASGDHWGTLDRGGAEQPSRLGTKRDVSQCSGPSAGVLKNARRS